MKQIKNICKNIYWIPDVYTYDIGVQSFSFLSYVFFYRGKAIITGA